MMQLPETHPSLIVRLQSERSELAWAEFLAEYEPFLRRLIERQGVPQRHVPDVTQQLLFGIARSVGKWRDDGIDASFRRWLCRVARNVVIRFMSRERKQVGARGGTDLLELLENVTDSSDDELTRQYEVELVLWAADAVKKEFRETSWQAFWATLVQGRPVAEVAEELGVSAGSIYMSRSRIVARIQAKLRPILNS